MSRGLDGTIYNIFTSLYGNNNLVRHGEEAMGCKFMEIPIDKEELEIPCIALRKFLNLVETHRDTEYSKMILNIYTYDSTPYYKTLSRNLYDVLHTSVDNALIKLYLDPKNPQSDYYYGSFGSIFTKGFIPIMLCSWKIKREKDPNSERYIYSFIKPLVRIAQHPFILQSDSLLKFISKKFPIAAMDNNIFAPSSYRARENPTVIIEDIPFEIKHVDTPSISTDNSQLIKVALDHIDEINQQQ